MSTRGGLARTAKPYGGGGRAFMRIADGAYRSQSGPCCRRWSAPVGGIKNTHKTSGNGRCLRSAVGELCFNKVTAIARALRSLISKTHVNTSI